MANSKKIKTEEILIDEYHPFNPLDKSVIGKSVAEAAINAEISPLPPMEFTGAGVYLIYYTGDFPLYKEIAQLNRNDQFLAPIYIGKAVPNGARKGGFSDNPNPGKVLYKRLLDHEKSINSAQNLDINDFKCRYLAIDDIWIPLAESLLIDRFSPLWNLVVEGFGNHDPGIGRTNGKKPLWDLLHPGRPWANNLNNPDLTLEQLEQRILEHLKTVYPKK